MNTTETDTPRSETLESTRQSLEQSRTPAYGDAMRLCRQLERELNDANKRIAILERRPMTAEEICQP